MECLDFKASMDIDKDMEMNYSNLDIGKARGDSMVKVITIVTGYGINHQ